MNALREIATAQNGMISIVVPKEYKQKRFEVIAIPIDEKDETTALKNKMAAFLKTLPTTKPAIDDAIIFDEIKAIRKQRYARNQH